MKELQDYINAYNDNKSIDEAEAIISFVNYEYGESPFESFDSEIFALPFYNYVKREFPEVDLSDVDPKSEFFESLSVSTPLDEYLSENMDKCPNEEYDYWDWTYRVFVEAMAEANLLDKMVSTLIENYE